MLVEGKFISSLVSKYGKHSVYTDGGTWYDQACNIIGLKHYLHSSIEKSLMERVMQYFKDRTESFDNYFPCIKKKGNKNCDLSHANNWAKLFIYLYSTRIKNTYYSGLEVKSPNLTQP